MINLNNIPRLTLIYQLGGHYFEAVYYWEEIEPGRFRAECHVINWLKDFMPTQEEADRAMEFAELQGVDLIKADFDDRDYDSMRPGK